MKFSFNKKLASILCVILIFAQVIPMTYAESFGNLKASGNISTGDDREISELIVKTRPTKQVYSIGESFESEGMVINAYYSDDTQEDVTDMVTFSGFDSSKSGIKTVTASYGGVSTTFTVTVKEVAGTTVQTEPAETTATTVTTTQTVATTQTTVVQTTYDEMDTSIVSLIVASMPSKTNYKVGEKFDRTGLVVQALYDDDSVTEVTGYRVNGFDSSTVGTKTITLSYKGHTTTMDITVYQVATTSTTSTTVVTEPTEVTTATATTATTATTVVTEPTEVTTQSTAATDDVSEIYIKSQPTKKQYTVGEEFDESGLVVYAYFNNEKSGAVYDYTLSGFDSNTPGVQTITVTYGTHTAEFTVTVKGSATTASTATTATTVVTEPTEVTTTQATVTELFIKTQPTKKVYSIGESLDSTGLVVWAYYSDDTSKEITDYTLSGFDSTTSGSKAVKVSYGGASVEFNVTVKEPAGTTATTVVTEPTEVTSVTEATQATSATSTTSTTATVTASIQPTQATTQVSITELFIKTQPTKKVYNIGESLDSTGLVVWAYYSDDTSKEITGYTLSGFDSTTSGSKTVTVSYGGASVEFNVTVKEPAGTTATTVVTEPTEATSVTEATQSTSATSTTATTAPATASIQPVSTQITITELFIKSQPTKKVYNIGESFDKTGLVIWAYYSDDTSKEITVYTLTGFDSTTSGSKTVKASYGGASVEFEVTVKEQAGTTASAVVTEPTESTTVTESTATQGTASTDVTENTSSTTSTTATKSGDVTVKELIVKSLPSQKYFNIGERFDTTGLVIEAYYSDDTSEVVTDYTLSGYDNTTPGDKTITVSYGGATTTFSISIKDITVPTEATTTEATVAELIVKSLPDKKYYDLGENFDTTGLVIEAYYSDDSSKVVTDYTLSGYDNTTAGDKTITVSYGGATTTFSISIKDMTVPTEATTTEAKVTELIVKSLPNKKFYNIGDSFDTTGLVIEAYYSDDTSKVVTDYKLSGFSSKTAGDKTITVSYSGAKTTFSVSIKEQMGTTATTATSSQIKVVSSLKAGKTSKITVSNSGSSKVTYASSKKSVAKVSSAGKITTLKKGTAKITVTLGGTKYTYTVKVTTNPKLSKKTVTVKIGKTVKVKITGKASGVNNKYTNTKYAKITSKKSATTLKVKGLKKGTTTLKIKVNGYILKLKVKVK